MPDVCPHCGAQHPESSRFCPQTGQPVRERVATPSPPHPMKWEYKDIPVPLEVPIGGPGPFSGEIVREVERLVRAALDNAAAEGWEAVHPTSLERLFEAMPTRIIYEPDGPCRWASATIRLKRLAPA